MWEAALLLATHLSCTDAGRELVVGRRVHELGAGVGLPGLASLAAGAADVVLSDYPPCVVGNLCANARRNPAPAHVGDGTARAIQLDWRDVDLNQPLPLPLPEPEPEPEVDPAPALTGPDPLPSDMRAIVLNLTRRADLNYPTIDEVRRAFQRSGGVVQIHRAEAVERLRKAARGQPAREAPSATISEHLPRLGWDADVVIGAALVYGPHHAEPLATCIARLLQPGPSWHRDAAGMRKRAVIVQIPTRPVSENRQAINDANVWHFSCPLFPVVLYAADSVGFYYCHDRGSIVGCVSVIAAVCRRFSTLPSSRSMSAFPDKNLQPHKLVTRYQRNRAITCANEVPSRHPCDRSQSLPSVAALTRRRLRDH